jgi:ribosome-associated protein
MKITELLNLVTHTLEDNKAEEITSLDVHQLTTITSWMVICTATSKRHAHALGDHLISKIKAQGIQPLGVEGATKSEWLLVDLGEIVVHIMLEETRKFYSLEKLWSATLRVREDAD